MKPIKLERGTFRVVRNCCVEGNCEICHGGFTKAKRKPIIQLDQLSEESAKAVAANWSSYQARVEPMP